MIADLKAGDLHSGAWIQLRAAYEARLHDLRRQNDALNIEDKRRYFLLGQIEEIKELLRHDPQAAL